MTAIKEKVNKLHIKQNCSRALNLGGQGLKSSRSFVFIELQREKLDQLVGKNPNQLCR